MLNQNSLYYSENPYKWELLQSVSDYDQDLADQLMEQNYYSMYVDQVESWGWSELKQEAENNPQESFDGDTYGSVYLGTVFEIMPSGKYWTFYADSNVDRIEAIQDTAFTDAMDSVAQDHDMWIESGEGDPCDLYACVTVESEEIEE